jgi:hypothetical protein
LSIKKSKAGLFRPAFDFYQTVRYADFYVLRFKDEEELTNREDIIPPLEPPPEGDK